MHSFTRLRVKELYSGETLRIVPQILACKKRQLQSWKNVGIEFHVRRNLFKKLHILPMTSQYVLSLLIFVAQNNNLFSTNTENHNIDTIQRNDLYLPQANLIIYQKGAYYSRIKIFNHLSLEIKNDAGNPKKYKIALKQFVYTCSFYTLEELLCHKISCYIGRRFAVLPTYVRPI